MLTRTYSVPSPLDGKTLSESTSLKLAVVLGRNVWQRRLALQMSISTAAFALGISETAYTARECGDHRFTPKEIVDLCGMLHVKPSVLFAESGSL